MRLLWYFNTIIKLWVNYGGGGTPRGSKCGLRIQRIGFSVVSEHYGNLLPRDPVGFEIFTGVYSGVVVFHRNILRCCFFHRSSTRLTSFTPGWPRCDQIWRECTGVTKFDRSAPVWPNLTGVYRCDKISPEWHCSDHFSPNSAKFCQILPNSAKFCQILPNSAKFC